MYNKKISGITPELQRIFHAYSWEGNVRELKNAVELMVSRAEDGALLSFSHLPEYLQARIGGRRRRPCRARTFGRAGRKTSITSL